jgi:hypothetical protein
MNLEQRVERLERCLLGVFGLLTGSIEEISDKEEFEQFKLGIGQELDEMAEGL